MTDIHSYAIVIIAGGIGALIAASFSALRKKKLLKHHIETLDRVNLEIDSILDASARLLKNPATPQTVRDTILLLLKGMQDPVIGRLLASALQEDLDNVPAESPLLAAVSKLRTDEPQLSEDVETALLGLANLALPCKYAGYDAPEIITHSAVAPSRRYRTIAGAISKQTSGPAFMNGAIPA